MGVLFLFLVILIVIFKSFFLKIKIFEEGTPLPYPEPPIDPHMNYSMHSDLHDRSLLKYLIALTYFTTTMYQEIVGVSARVVRVHKVGHLEFCCEKLLPY